MPEQVHIVSAFRVTPCTCPFLSSTSVPWRWIKEKETRKTRASFIRIPLSLPVLRNLSTVVPLTRPVVRCSFLSILLDLIRFNTLTTCHTLFCRPENHLLRFWFCWPGPASCDERMMVVELKNILADLLTSNPSLSLCLSPSVSLLPSPSLTLPQRWNIIGY